jgi:hypothetical protein
MKLRHHDLKIPEDGSDPFVNCKLDRKKYADVLTGIVDGYADGFVLAINNPWGEGKTTFVKMWRQHLINEGFPTLYFNAWENDFQQDVLVALISELSELENKPEAQFKDVLKKVVPLTGKLIPKILKHLVKRYGGDDAAQDILEAVGEYTEEQLKELTDSYKEKKESVKKFRHSLEAFANEAGGDKPLVFIIDELDRCRPNYAVEILEQIKHLFSVSGIVFVLSIDKVQLGHAICGVYGSDNINSQEYLRRFIDLEYSIPKPLAIGIVNYFYTYFEFESFINSEKRSKSHNFREDKLSFVSFATILLSNKDLSLRQVEKLFAHTRLVLNSFKTDNFIFPRLLLLLMFIRISHPDIINTIKEKRITTQKLIEKIESLFPDNVTDEKSLRSFAFTMVELAVFYHNFFNEGVQKPTILYKEGSSGEKTTDLESKFDKSENKNDLIAAYEGLRYRGHHRGSTISFLLKKIDLLEPVNFQ